MKRIDTVAVLEMYTAMAYLYRYTVLLNNGYGWRKRFANLTILKQEVMLKKGCAWHYYAYDKRLELSTVSDQLNLLVFHFFYLFVRSSNTKPWTINCQWEKEARAKRVGLWAASNPEKPWEWRKDRREGRWTTIKTTVNGLCLPPETILPRHNQARVNIHNQDLELLAKKRNKATLKDNCKFMYYLIQNLF